MGEILHGDEVGASVPAYIFEGIEIAGDYWNGGCYQCEVLIQTLQQNPVREHSTLFTRPVRMLEKQSPNIIRASLIPVISSVDMMSPAAGISVSYACSLFGKSSSYLPPLGVVGLSRSFTVDDGADMSNNQHLSLCIDSYK